LSKTPKLWRSKSKIDDEIDASPETDQVPKESLPYGMMLQKKTGRRPGADGFVLAVV